MEQLKEAECSEAQLPLSSKVTKTFSKQNEFLKYGREELLDLLTHLETELEAREIAFNVLKLKFSKRDISLYYGCLEALQCDGFILKYNEEIEKSKSKEIKSFYEGQKDSLQKAFSAKNKAILVLKFQLQTLQEQYQKVCKTLSEDRDQLSHFRNEFSKFRELHEKDMNLLKEKYDEASKERSNLLDKVQSLEEELEMTRKKCQLHKDGAMLLIMDRNWLAHKISHLIDVVNLLEDSLDSKTTELSETREELAKLKSEYEVTRVSLTRSREDLNCEFTEVIKSKDVEILNLKMELDRLKALSSSVGRETPSQSRISSILHNGIAKDALRTECKSVYDNVDQSADAGGGSSDDKVWLPRDVGPSPFNDTATIKRGSFVRPSASEDFSGFDIFGREMADLQELLVSMASPPNDSTNRPKHPIDGKASWRSDQNIAKPLDIRTFLLSLRTAISNGNVSRLRELLEQQRQDPTFMHHKLPIGILPLHYAVECCFEACVRVLLENGFDANVQNEEKTSAMHIASSEGSLECLKVLLECGASVFLTNHIGMTPLHCAASSGHVDCCIQLLHSGAQIDALNLNSWTPLHVCTFSGHSHCLKALLTFRTSDKTKDEAYEALICDIVNMADKDGCTLAFLASAKETKDCLEVLAQCCPLDLQRRDKWSRSILDVASQACLSFLLRSESTQEITCCIAVDVGWDSNPDKLSKSGSAKQLSSSTFMSPAKTSFASQKTGKKSYAIGSMTVSKSTNWAEVEEKLGTAFLNHVSEVSIGLRTKKISRSEQESPDTPNPFTMGLTVKSIKYFSIGRYHWSPGTITDKHPFEMLTTHNTSQISIKLFGLDNNSPDSLAYDSLTPIYVLQNYLRLVQQYKSVVFYGPKGVGKSFLVRRLASYIQAQESTSGFVSEVSFTTLHPSFTNNDLIKLLIDKGCLIDTKQLFPPPTAPVLVFDDLTQVTVDDVFKEISSSIENRGPNNKLSLKSDAAREACYYMHPNCYVICTMDKPRSIGLELSIQQRFKWVQLRCDQEPSKYLLHRHLLRNLADSHQGSIPLPDNSVYKAVEWLICVWQRLNDGIVKLGLLDLVFGPCYFLPCPIEKNKPKAILRWLISLWNQIIAPAISEAVIKSSGSVLPKEGDSQQKVTSTALYVLMQRAVVPGCPLAGQERDRYLACFHGSNELDIKVKTDKKEVGRPSHFDSPTLKYQLRASDTCTRSQCDVSPLKDSSFTRFQSSSETLARLPASPAKSTCTKLPSRSMNELFPSPPSSSKQHAG